MNIWAELAISAFLVVGGFFLFVGSFALAKLPDTMRRLHGPTKATTLGVGSILIASMLYFLFARGDLSMHELLITLFLFLTAPVSAHLVAKAYLRERSMDPASSNGRGIDRGRWKLAGPGLLSGRSSQRS